MQHEFVITVTFLLEMIISYVFFLQQGEVRRKKWVCWAIGTGLFLSGALLDFLFSNTVWLNGMYFIVINFLFGLFAFDVRPGRALFGALVLTALSTTLEYVTIFAMSFLVKVPNDYYLQDVSYLILVASISKTLYFAVSAALAKCTQTEKSSVRYPGVFYIYPFAVVFVAILLWVVCVKYGVSGIYLLLASGVCMILLLSAILLFVFYQKTAQKESHLNSLQSQLEKIELDKRYYDILEKQNEDLMIYAHDTNKHLNAIRALNDDPQIETYLNKMSDQLQEYSRSGYSGNRMLDVICSKYTAECALNNISLEIDMRLANFKYIDDFDLVTLFSNILDNAVEAAVQSEKKEIRMFTDHKNTYDVITVENSCDHPPRVRDRELKTTKKNQRLHGLGMKSVGKTLRKYGGDFAWTYDEVLRQFCVTIMVSPRCAQKDAVSPAEHSAP